MFRCPAVRQSLRASFTSINLRQELGAGAIESPVESQHQDSERVLPCLLVTATIFLTTLKVFLTPEWSGGTLNGRIEFHLEAMKWMFLLVAILVCTLAG